MSDKQAFKYGYKYFSENLSAAAAGTYTDATSTAYLGEVQGGIDNLSQAMVQYVGDNRPQVHGFVFETFERGSFMVDAAAKRTGENSWIPSAAPFASADVKTSWGEDFQAKAYQSGSASGLSQSVSYEQRYNEYLGALRRDNKPEISWEEYCKQRGIDPEIDRRLSIYEAQTRLIPTDQLEDARKALQRAIDNSTDPVVRQRYIDTINKLTDHIESPTGAKSMPLTYDETMALSKCAKEGRFNPADYDLMLAKKADYMYLLNKAAMAGLSAAAVSGVMKAAPDIAKALIVLIRDGKVTEDDLKKIGQGLSSGATEGLVRGFMLAAIKDVCSLGFLGEELQRHSLDTTSAFVPIATQIVSVVIGTMSDSIRLAQGEIDRYEFIELAQKRVFITGWSVGIGLAANSVIPVVGYVIGSFVGSVVGGLVFQAREQIFMSLCVEHGWTFFGIVEQDYTLPQEMIKYLGLEQYQYETYEYEEYSYDKYEPETYEFETYEFEKLGITILERGVIGVRKVGYRAHIV